MMIVVGEAGVPACTWGSLELTGEQSARLRSLWLGGVPQNRVRRTKDKEKGPDAVRPGVSGSVVGLPVRALAGS